MDWQPYEPTYFLAGIGGESLLIRQNVFEVSSIPEEMILGGVTEPFESVGKDWNSCITDRLTFESPAIVSDHDFEEREAFLAPANEEVPPKFRPRDHQAGLSHQPSVIRAVVHDPGRPGKLPFHAGR